MNDAHLPDNGQDDRAHRRLGGGADSKGMHAICTALLAAGKGDLDTAAVATVLEQLAATGIKTPSAEGE